MMTENRKGMKDIGTSKRKSRFKEAVMMYTPYNSKLSNSGSEITVMPNTTRFSCSLFNGGKNNVRFQECVSLILLKLPNFKNSSTA